MELMYIATAALGGGKQIQSETGSFEECAKWTDDVIRANGGDITVQIRQVEGGGK